MSSTPSSSSVSPLGPIDPKSVIAEDHGANEAEQKAPWIVRKLVGSMTGRIVMSSYESLRAAGTSVICLSPTLLLLFLPCIRFRDLAVHAIIVGTGGVAGVAAPVMGPVADVAVGAFGNTIIVDVALNLGAEGSTKPLDKLVFDRIKSPALETTGLKVLAITLKFKHTVEDAYLGFFRSSLHKDSSLFSSVKDYLATEKGWFSPYLFASARRPVIPRSVKPDVVFCHGDYKIGETLLAETSTRIFLCDPPVEPSDADLVPPEPSYLQKLQKKLSLPKISNLFKHHEEPHPVEEGSTLPPRPPPSPEPELTVLPPPIAPRRLVVMLIGIKPHRGGIWTSSQRPSESVIQYAIMNGAPALVLPARTGAPLIAWDTLTLTDIWKIPIPNTNEAIPGSKLEGIVVVPQNLRASPEDEKPVDDAGKKAALKTSLQLLFGAAIRTQESKDVKKEVDPDRAGLVFWRIV
ncbi:hypothetical protein DL96DRAFT_1668130 [Flagelloscypha sp. PMI_526]|nr:hypothetical protein DL96DRAFT_1668130 [Flagelloscypha sp. PMI_526]